MGGGKGGAPDVHIITYTYNVRSAIVFAWGPIDVFLRLDLNSDFTIHNKYRASAAGLVHEMLNDGVWTLPTGSAYAPIPIASDYFSLSTGGPIWAGNIYFGTSTQPVDNGLNTYMGHSEWTPAYRDTAYLAAQWNLGSNPSVPAVSFTFARYYAPCNLILRNVIDDPDGGRGINPAQALYDILTNQNYGFGLDVELLAVESFVEVGETLYLEGLGLGHAIVGGEIFNSVRTMLDWIDGELVYVRGKIFLKLRRFDYIIANLPLITDVDIKARSFVFTRPSWYATKNVVYVNFNDIHREHDQNTVYAENLANQNLSGTVRVQEFNFDVHTNVVTAQKVCNRLLHRQSYPWTVVEFECFTAGDVLEVYECFRLKHDYYNLSGVFRVVEKVKQGPNVWKIQAIEDLHAPETAFVGFEFEVDHPQYWDPGNVEWDVRFYESYYRGLLALPYSLTPITFRAGASFNWNLINNKPGMEWYEVPPLDAVLYQIDLDGDGVYDWADETLYACIGTVSPLNGPAISGMDFIMEPDFHYRWDVTAVKTILVGDEMMKVASIEPYEEDTTKWLVTIEERYIESSPKAYWTFLDPPASPPANSRVFNPDCRALNTEIPRLYTGTYDFHMTPHYLLPRPHYDSDGIKIKRQSFFELIKRPMDVYRGGLVWNPNVWETTHTHYIYYASREQPIPIPCAPLSKYPQADIKFCPYASMTPYSASCNYDQDWIDQAHTDKRTGTKGYFWAWDGYYERDGEPFICDAHISEPYDPFGVWSNDAWAFESNTANVAYCQTCGSETENYLSGRGVSIGSLSSFEGGVTEVKARIYGVSSQSGITYSSIAAKVTSAGGVSVLGTLNWSVNSLFDFDNVPYSDASNEGFGPYTTLAVPLGGWTLSNIQNLGVKAWIQGSEGQTVGVEAGIGQIEVFVCNDWYRNPHLGIVGDAIWVVDLDVEQGDNVWAWTTSDLTTRGMTFGYRYVWSPQGAVDGLPGIWTDLKSGATYLQDNYVWYDAGWHILQYTHIDTWPHGFSYDYKAVYAKDTPGG